MVITKAQRRLSKQQIRGGGWGGGGGGSLSVDAAVRRGCGAGSSLARRARVRGAAFVRAAARRQERTGPAPYCGRKAPARLPHHHRPSCDGRSVTAVTASLCGGCHCFPLPIPGGKRVESHHHPSCGSRARSMRLCSRPIGRWSPAGETDSATAALTAAPGRGACAARAAGFGRRPAAARPVGSAGGGPCRGRASEARNPGPDSGGGGAGAFAADGALRLSGEDTPYYSESLVRT